MGRRALTDEEKAERVAAKKAEKLAKREAERQARIAEWARQAEESRRVTLTTLPSDLVSQFVSAIEKSNSMVGNDFVNDIRHKWQQYGNLSENQIKAFVKCVLGQSQKEIISDVIEDFFTIGEEEYLTNLLVEKIDNVVEPNGMGGLTTSHKVCLFLEKPGISFRITTNNKKMIGTFDTALKNQKRVNIRATTRWHPTGSNIIILKPTKIQIEVID